MGWSSGEEICEHFGLSSDGSDLAAVRDHLFEKARELNAGHPGNTHPDFAEVVMALESLTALERQERDRRLPVAIPEKPAVVESPVPTPAPGPKHVEISASTAAVLAPSKREFKQQTIGLGAVGGVAAVVVSFPETLTSNPWLESALTDGNGTPYPQVGMAWLFVLILVASIWLSLWRRHRRLEQFSRRAHDADRLLDVVRDAILDRKTGSSLYPDDYRAALITNLLDIQEPRYSQLKEASEEEAKALWKAYDEAQRTAIEALSEAESDVIDSAVDAALEWFYSMGWIRRSTDYAFEVSYEVVGEFQR